MFGMRYLEKEDETVPHFNRLYALALWGEANLIENSMQIRDIKELLDSSIELDKNKCSTDPIS